MKKIISIFVFIFTILTTYAQAPAPSGLPAPYSTGYYRIGWIQSDSGFIYAPRDTTIRSRFPGLTLFWGHNGVDTSTWLWNGRKYIKELNSQDTLPGRFLVTPSFLNSQGFLKNITGLFTTGTGYSLNGSGTIGSPYSLTISSSIDSAVNPGSFLIQSIVGTTKTFNVDTSSTALGGIFLKKKDSTIFATQTQLSTGLSSKQNTITTGTNLQYFRGDLSLATFPTNLSSFTNGPGYLTANQSISFTASGDVTGTFTHPTTLTPVLTLKNTGIGAGACTNCNITFDAQGREISYSNGSGIAFNQDSIKHRFVDTGSTARNLYTLAWDSTNKKWILTAPGTGGGGTGTVTNFSFTAANGFTGNVTNPSTVPALTVGTSITGLLFGNGTAISNATVSPPLTYSTGALGIQIASGSQAGALSSTDWTTFNGKINLTSLSATSPLLYNNTTGVFSIQVANTSQNGYLTSTDWNTFNGKQGALILTTTGTSGAATLVGTTLNIPNYATGSGAVSSVSNSDGTLTISPTTGAVVASLALGHANTWTGLQTQPAPIFTSLTSSGTNDSVLTVDPSTGQVHRRYGSFQFYAANGLSPSTVIADSFYLGGALNQNTTIATAGFNFSITGLPSKATALGTDSVLIENLAGQFFKLPVPSGGGSAITSLTTDVVATGPGAAVATIQPNVVTYAKIQAAAGQGLMGATGAANFGLVTLGTNLSMTGSVLNAAGGSDSAIWKNNGVYTGDHTLTMAGFSQSFVGGKTLLDTMFSHVTTLTTAKNAYFFGHSVVQGYYAVNASGNIDSARRWSALLCRNQGWAEVNRGLASLTAENRTPFVTNLLANFVTSIPFYSATRDTIFFIQCAINDITKAGQGSTQYNTNNYKTDLGAYVDSVLGRGWPSNRIVIIGDSYTDTLITTNNTKLLQDSFFLAQQTVATNKSTFFIDVYHTSLANNSWWLFGQDRLHPGNEGHSAEASVIINSLGATVNRNGQTVAVNGVTEVNQLAIKQADTSQAAAFELGLNTNNRVVRIPWGRHIINGDSIAQNGVVNLNGYIKINNPNIGAVLPDNLVKTRGLVLGNYFPATSTTQQVSPPLSQYASYWNTTASKSDSVNFFWYVNPVSGANAGASTYRLRTQDNNAAFVDLMYTRQDGTQWNFSTGNAGTTTFNLGGGITTLFSNGAFNFNNNNIVNFNYGSGSAYHSSFTAATLYGTGDELLQFQPPAGAYTVLDAFGGSGLVLGTRSGANPIKFALNGIVRSTLTGGGSGGAAWYIGGNSNATAQMHISAGTAVGGTAPLKFTTSGAVLLTTPEAGAMEVLADSLYWTGNSGTRYKVYPQSAGGTNIYNADGTLTANRSMSGATFNLSLGTSGSPLGGLTVYSNGGSVFNNGKYQSAQGSQILGASSTINNAVTGASGNVTDFSAYAFLAPTVSSTNTGVTYPNPATVYIDGPPVSSTNSTFTGIAYSLNVNSGISHFGLGPSNFSAIFDGTVYINGGTKTNTFGLSLGASTSFMCAYHLDAGVDVTTPVPGMAWYNGTNYYFNSNTEGTIDLAGGTRNYRHTIFVPTTGGTVNLVSKQYNIINPAGALVALTVNLPSSPVNNDVVYIKFTQAITTVTYANGTVVDGITAPTAGGLTILTYDLVTNSWY